MDAEFAAGLSRASFFGGAVLILVLAALIGIVVLVGKYEFLKMEHEDLKEELNELKHTVEKMQWENEHTRSQKGGEGMREEADR